jgi:hypothetical protein
MPLGIGEYALHRIHLPVFVPAHGSSTLGKRSMKGNATIMRVDVEAKDGDGHCAT